jgi:hypothetical protein
MPKIVPKKAPPVFNRRRHRVFIFIFQQQNQQQQQLHDDHLSLVRARRRVVSSQQ